MQYVRNNMIYTNESRIKSVKDVEAFFHHILPAFEQKMAKKIDCLLWTDKNVGKT